MKLTGLEVLTPQNLRQLSQVFRVKTGPASAGRYQRCYLARRSRRVRGVASLVLGCVAAATFAVHFSEAGQTPAAPNQTQGAAGQAQEPRRRREVTPEERARIEAALPAKAPAVPKKPRQLLVYDRNVAYGGHASIPYANLAMQLMGEKTGSFAATLSSDPAALEPSSLAQFDAVYLNNTVGDIFATPEVRAAFAAFVANGGGLVGNHGASVASTTWTEFGEILGARGASHREPDEKAVINVEDPTNPIVRAFDGKPFEFTDEFYRLAAPYSRDKVRVLMSLDPIATDMMQGRCFGQCLRDDNDYPVAWIANTARVASFTRAWDIARPCSGTPDARHVPCRRAVRARRSAGRCHPPPAQDRSVRRRAGRHGAIRLGQDRGPVRRFERELVLVAATKEGAAAAEGKMLKILQSNAPLGAKDVLCRQLAIFGSSRSEPVLQKMLRDKDTEAMARYALHGLKAK